MERDLASGKEREILRRPKSTPINDWTLSPDGHSVWMVVTDTALQISELLVVPLTGGEARVIVRRPRIGALTFSPDGRYLATAFLDATARATAVLLVPAVEGEPRELIRAIAPDNIGLVTWAPDSRSVYFRRRPAGASGRTELWRMQIDGDEAQKIDGTDQLDPALPFAMSPDARQLAFIRGDGGGPVKSEVWKLENFLPPSTSK
jgi:Tol biopolymer transport system component